MQSIFLLLLATAAFFITWAITGLCLRMAQRVGLVDVPNERSSHSQPTPRGGGIGFVTAFTAALGVTAWHHDLPVSVCMALSSGLLVAFVGFYDDRWTMSASKRFLVHVIAALWTLYSLGYFDSSSDIVSVVVVTVVALCMTFAFVWCINLTNFMDGIDGIAASQILVVAGVCSLISVVAFPGPGALLWLLLAAGAGGFLVWNWHPARIFMGDVGSGFLGFSVAAIVAVQMCQSKGALWPTMIMMSVFIVDATVTLSRRFLNGEKWYAPHRKHAFQIASDRWGHARVVRGIMGINLVWLAPLAVCSVVWPQFGLAFALTALSPVFFLQQQITKDLSWGVGVAKAPAKTAFSEVEPIS